jgi:Tol biopolymer transport system component
MNPHDRDTLIKMALTPSMELRVPTDLENDIQALIAETPQRRPGLGARLRSRWLPGVPPRLVPPQERGPWTVLRTMFHIGDSYQWNARRAVVLALALVALTALLIVSILLVGQQLNRLHGGRLGFIRDGDVYVANGDGSGAVRLLHVDGTQFFNPVWSPDGTRMAVDMAGGAVLVDAATGATRRIGGRDPTWSPDGSLVAVHDVSPPGSVPQLEILDAGTGTPTMFLSGAQYSAMVWSPDGRWIASRTNAVWLLDPVTAALVKIDDTFAQSESPRDTSWAPDSTKLAYIRYVDCGSERCPTQVYMAGADGTHVTQLLPGAGSLDHPTWSPDGKWMAFRRNRSGGVIVSRPDGTQQRTITTTAVETYAWNPASDGLRFTVPAAFGQPSQLWEGTLDGATRPLGISLDATDGVSGNEFAWQGPIGEREAPALPNVPRVSPLPTLAIATAPAASPVDLTGRWPTLASSTEEGCTPGKLDTETGAFASLAMLCGEQTQGVDFAAWSPDGSIYAAVLAGQADTTTLALVQANGTVTRNVAGLRSVGSVTWSPDGAWLTTAGGRDLLLKADGTLVRELPGTASWTPGGRHLVVSTADPTLLVGRPDGSELRSIGSFPTPAAWAPDESRFAFARDGDIWTAALDGTDVRNLTAFPLGGAGTVSWSPDGQSIAVAQSRGLWLMHRDGSARQFVDLGQSADRFPTHVAWSPDGRWIARDLWVNDGADLRARVILIAADGSSAIGIEDASDPVWSPDGRYLAVATSGGQYTVVNADGTGRRTLRGVTTGMISGFAWIP